MSDIRQSQYDTIATELTTELNALAAAGKSAPSAANDNSTDLHQFDDLELAVTFGVSPNANEAVEVYLLPSVDGTNYVDGDASTDPAPNTLIGIFPVKASTSAQRLAIQDVPIPPGLFKYMVINQTGQAFSASGHTLKRRPHSHTVT